MYSCLYKIFCWNHSKQFCKFLRNRTALKQEPFSYGGPIWMYVCRYIWYNQIIKTMCMFIFMMRQHNDLTFYNHLIDAADKKVFVSWNKHSCHQVAFYDQCYCYEMWKWLKSDPKLLPLIVDWNSDTGWLDILATISPEKYQYFWGFGIALHRQYTNNSLVCLCLLSKTDQKYINICVDKCLTDAPANLYCIQILLQAC